MPRAAQPVGGPMKNHFPGAVCSARSARPWPACWPPRRPRPPRPPCQKVLVSADAPKGYDPTQHKWLMAIDANRCIGCGLCAEACKKENHVPEGPYFRTWVERYIITKPKPGSGAARGETLVDCPERRHARVSASRRCRRRKSSIRSSCPSCAISASILPAPRCARWAPPSTRRTARC